jgi:hypothetical protein
LKTDLLNPFDPTYGNGNGKTMATTEEMLLIRERQRELKEIIRLNKQRNPNYRLSTLKETNNAPQTTLDAYLNEHTHSKLSQKPAEVDRSGLLRAIDRIGS